MNGWLLDTKVLSEVIKRRPEPKVVQFIAAQPIDRLLISVVTFAEIRYGIERVTDVIRRAQLGDWLSNRIRPMFTGRALPISEDVMLKWRLLLEQGRAAGHAFPQPDLIIAATALLYGLTIVTRDSRDFARAHAPVFNPWTDETPP
ncbi:MAG: toxin FitB [Acetobacteraceae bacterium]|nr:toxin FitB [Acetobacteraceae bacterium]